MVSFQTLFPKLNKMISTDHHHDHESEMMSNSKKRKWDDFVEAEDDEILPADHKPWKNPKSFISGDIQLHLETPLPSEWQRCLDIQSGEIHFYNTRTHKRTVKDPRRESSPEASSPNQDHCHMSLDLELNLPCHSSSFNTNSSSSPSEKSNPTMTKTTTKPPSDNLFMSLSSVTKQTYFDTEPDHEEVEMVATACMKCHMLVMLCKSSPTCPNCKFVHPPYQTPQDLFKPRLSLSC